MHNAVFCDIFIHGGEIREGYVEDTAVHYET